MLKNIVKRAGIIFFALLFLWYLVPIILRGVESVRMVSVFSGDESNSVYLIKGIFENKTLDLNFYYYGSIYFYITSFFLLLYKIFFPLTETSIIIALRSISVLFGGLSVFALYLLAKEASDYKTALLACFLFAFTPEILQWSTIAHPDTVGIFFNIVCLYFCCRLVKNFTFRDLFLASIFSALSFGTKYSGVFFIPVIWLASIMSVKQNKYMLNNSPSHLLRICYMLLALLCLVSFVLGFTLNGIMEILYSRAFVLAKIDPRIIGKLQLACVGFGMVLLVLLFLNRKYNILKTSIIAQRIFINILLSTFVFSAVFFITNPYSITHLRSLIWAIRSQSAVLYFGHFSAVNKNGFLWLDVLASPHLVGMGGMLLFVYYLLKRTIFNMRTIGERRLKFDSEEKIILIAITLVFFLLFFRVNWRCYRYILPIVPFIFIFASKVFFELWKDRNKSMRMIAIVLLVLSFWPRVILAIEFRREQTGKMENNNYIKAGKWIEKEFPSNCRIAYDCYSYIPPNFNDISGSMGQTEELIEKFDPCLIVINDNIVSRYSDIRMDFTYGTKRDEYNKIQRFYTKLRANKIHPYKKVKDFGEVQVFCKKDRKC